jgi:primosomal protein N' (replication factor Y)
MAKKYRTKSLFETEERRYRENCRNTVRVAFDSGVDREFDYLLSDELLPVSPGQRVKVPFGRKNKLKTGFCTELNPELQSSREFELKPVKKIIDPEPLLAPQMLELARWISYYYVAPLGQVLAAMVPSAVKNSTGVKKKQYVYLADRKFDPEESLRGKKQKAIVNHLKKTAAFSEKSAVEKNELLSSVGCTAAPLKKLAENQLVKIVRKTTLPKLPTIPENLTIQAEKVTLNTHQSQALNHINEKLDENQFAVSLLWGVTDSGKTEVYIRAVEKAIRLGKSAIVLIPEIALTSQIVERFSTRFEDIAVLHSGLTASQRNSEWQRIKHSQANVIIGARSAIFAPTANLGLVIVDEEHEPSFKQDTVPRYNARDVAVKRAQLNNAHCILGSATPSLESLVNSRTKKHFSLLKLPERVMDLPLPQMRLVDMKAQPKREMVELISDKLRLKLEQTLKKNEQAILLLNRRGYSSFVFCPSCKHTLHCRNCDVNLTFHKSQPAGKTNTAKKLSARYLQDGYAICHYCRARTLVPKNCPVCGKKMVMIGIGSQRLEEQLRAKFPKANIKRLDSDSMAGRDYYSILDEFSTNKIDILLGTQMLAKGLHFPNVTLVGIISADTSLYLPDFRSNERTFQLITQVAGRTGRSEKKGSVLVQTFLPDQPAIKFALTYNFEGFVKEELKHRKSCSLPPYYRLALVTLRDTKFERLEDCANAFRAKIDNIISQNNLDIKVRGPVPAVISRMHQFHRIQIIIQAPTAKIIHQLLQRLRQGAAYNSYTKTAIDVDPVNIL